jgi:hypothetical protein
VRAALAETEPAPAAEAATLADKRLEAVRATVKKAKIDTARLLEDKRVDVAADGEPQVQLDLADAEQSRGRRAPEPRRPLTSDADGTNAGR